MTTFAQIAKLYNSLSQEIKQKYPQLKDWGYTWNDALTNSMGRCVLRRGKKYIELSTQIVALNLQIDDFLKKIEETIIHEWAHALEYEEKKVLSHSPCWRKWMLELGKIPERCYDGTLWLMRPRGAFYAIRNTTTGRVFKYYNYKPSGEDVTKAHHWHRVQLLRPVHEDIALVNLNNAAYVTI